MFYSIYPFESERADYRNAILANLIYNINRGENEPSKVEDFIPKFGERLQDFKPETKETLIEKINLLENIFGNAKKEGG